MVGTRVVRGANGKLIVRERRPGRCIFCGGKKCLKETDRMRVDDRRAGRKKKVIIEVCMCQSKNFTGQVYIRDVKIREARKDKHNWIQPWQPKDHELRTIPLPEQIVSLLAAWQSVAPENCPYIFMEHGRWDYYQLRVAQRKWRVEQSLVNNVLRRFKTLCRKAKVGPCTVHDLRRSCITNWARELPIHVVQKLAGHSDIRTTQKYYLSIQAEDIQKAQRVQSKVLGKS